MYTELPRGNQAQNNLNIWGFPLMESIEEITYLNSLVHSWTLWVSVICFLIKFLPWRDCLDPSKFSVAVRQLRHGIKRRCCTSFCCPFYLFYKFQCWSKDIYFLSVEDCNLSLGIDDFGQTARKITTRRWEDTTAAYLKVGRRERKEDWI